MTIAFLWMVLLASLGLALLAVPLVPAWREWARPTDSKPLGVESGYAAEPDFFASRFRRSLAECTPPPPPPLSEWGRTGMPILFPASVTLDERVEARAPVVIEGDFHANAGGAFTALLASGSIRLGPRSEVTQWIHADGALALDADCVALRRASCGRTLAVSAGCSFERLHAPVIAFGAQDPAVKRRAPEGASAEFSTVRNVTRRAPGLYRAEGDCSLPEDSAFNGSLVVTGSLLIGAGCVVNGDVKARKGVIVGPGASIEGAVTCEGVIHIRERAFVKGPVVAEADVWIDCGAEVGGPTAPTTVTAENIIVEDGVVAHGTVHARDAGIVWSAA